MSSFDEIVDEFGVIVVRIADKLAELELAINNDTGFSAWLDTEMDDVALYGEEARAACARYLTILNYTESYGSKPCAIVAVSPVTLGLANKINALKVRAKELHESCHQCFIENDGSTLKKRNDRQRTLRMLKKRIEFPNINLDALDRAIPFLNKPASKARWSSSVMVPSERKTIADALKALKKKRLETFDDDAIDVLNNDIAQIESLPINTPVSFRPKNPINTQVCRLQGFTPGELPTSKTVYAANPVLVSNESDINTAIQWPNNDVSSRGRGKIVEDSPICFSLPQWFYYIVAASNPKRDVKYRHNPYAKTSYPGIWLGFRGAGESIKKFVMFTRRGKTPSSVTVGKAGISVAWTKAVDKHLSFEPDNRAGLSREQLIELAPNGEKVLRALDWRISHTDSS